jgi:hypothetical protein
MITTSVVLLLAVAVLVLVFYWSGRYGGRGRERGTSLRRGPGAHTTSTGRPKMSYAKREEAEARARLLSTRDGTPMNVYRCGTCAKWHVGHVK